jgi:hypothetical protein
MDLQTVLGDEAETLLTHECKGVTRDELVLPGPDFIDRVAAETDRPIPVLRNLQSLYNSCPSTRASSIPGRPASPHAPPTSTPRT